MDECRGKKEEKTVHRIKGITPLSYLRFLFMKTLILRSDLVGKKLIVSS